MRSTSPRARWRSGPGTGRPLRASRRRRGSRGPCRSARARRPRSPSPLHPGRRAGEPDGCRPGGPLRWCERWRPWRCACRSRPPWPRAPHRRDTRSHPRGGRSRATRRSARPSRARTRRPRCTPASGRRWRLHGWPMTAPACARCRARRPPPAGRRSMRGRGRGRLRPRRYTASSGDPRVHSTGAGTARSIETAREGSVGARPSLYVAMSNEHWHHDQRTPAFAYCVLRIAYCGRRHQPPTIAYRASRIAGGPKGRPCERRHQPPTIAGGPKGRLVQMSRPGLSAYGLPSTIRSAPKAARSSAGSRPSSVSARYRPTAWHC